MFKSSFDKLSKKPVNYSENFWGFEGLIYINEFSETA